MVSFPQFLSHDVPISVDRRLRSMTRGSKLVHRSLSMTSYKSSGLAATLTASATSTGRVRDARRTPDYVTLLTRNDPSQAHERIMCVHELKRYKLEDDHTGARTRLRLRNPSLDQIEIALTKMERQTGEQAQVAPYKFKHAKAIYVMCHIGMYFRVLRYVRKVSKPKPNEGQFGRVLLRYRSDIKDILNKDQTDFSTSFKRWWTRLRDYALQADEREEASADDESQSEENIEDAIYESDEDGACDSADVKDGLEAEADRGAIRRITNRRDLRRSAIPTLSWVQMRNHPQHLPSTRG